jgi:hypothetical protein
MFVHHTDESLILLNNDKYIHTVPTNTKSKFVNISYNSYIQLFEQDVDDKDALYPRLV